MARKVKGAKERRVALSTTVGPLTLVGLEELSSSMGISKGRVIDMAIRVLREIQTKEQLAEAYKAAADHHAEDAAAFIQTQLRGVPDL